MSRCAIVLLALLAAHQPGCEGCRPAPEPLDEVQAPAQTQPAPDAPEPEPAADAADALPEAVGALLPATLGLPRLPQALELGVTPLAALERFATGAGAPLAPPHEAVLLRVAAREMRFPTRADRLNEVALTFASVDAPTLRAWLGERWGAPLEAPDDSGLVFRGGAAPAAYWFDPQRGLRAKLVPRGRGSQLVWTRYAPLDALLAVTAAGRLGFEPPDGLTGASPQALRERYGRDLVVEGERTRLFLAPLELGLDPVVVGWPTPEPGAPVRGPLDLELPHAPAQGPFDAEALLAGLERHLGPLHRSGAPPGSVGRVVVGERTIDVWRLPAQSRLRLLVSSVP